LLYNVFESVGGKGAKLVLQYRSHQLVRLTGISATKQAPVRIPHIL